MAKQAPRKHIAISPEYFERIKTMAKARRVTIKTMIEIMTEEMEKRED